MKNNTMESENAMLANSIPKELIKIYFSLSPLDFFFKNGEHVVIETIFPRNHTIFVITLEKRHYL